MPFYPVMPPDVTPGCAEDAALGLLGQGGVIAVRVADLASPARQGLGKDGRTALTAAGAGRIRSGDLVVWLKPVAVAPAVVRRDGRVQAAGHPADHARLGVAEQRLDELCGVPGVIDQVARSAALGGRVKGAARRAMSPALAIRFTLLMTLVPDADYTEAIETLLGDLALVPWQRPYGVPTAAAACIWREALGPVPLERLREMALAGIDGKHRVHDYRAVTVGDLEVGSIDGSLVRVPDTPANRQAFGSAGTADDSSPYPQLRELRIKRKKYAAIRHDAGNGMSERAIERKHHVSRRTIIKALASADPPERKKIHREHAALNGLNGHIDAIIEAGPKVATATIWQRIADEHGTTVAYYTLRTYVASHRASGKTLGKS